MTITRVLIATDGSDHSLRAAEHVHSMMGTLGVDITLLHVLPDHPAAPEADGGLEEEVPADPEERARQALERTYWALHMDDHKVRRVIRRGDPVAAIIQEAVDGKHDLIVVGTRGHSGWKGHLTGSVSRQVIDEAPCAVLIVK